MAFSEIIVIALIALLVLGPERLPKLARDIGHFIGRARAMARQFTEQLDHEVRMEELHRQYQQPSSQPTATQPVSASASPTPTDPSGLAPTTPTSSAPIAPMTPATTVVDPVAAATSNRPVGNNNHQSAP